MRFSVIATAFLATAVSAGESTIYETVEYTITSCAATVTNCPARSTVVSTTSYPVITSSVSAIPTVYANKSSSAVYSYTAPVSVSKPVTVSTSTAAGVYSTSAPLLSTITISTCVPTVIYSTVTVAPTVSKAAPSSTGTISYAHNVTAPAATATPTQYTTSGASSVQGSILVAAFAGLAAFVFA